MVFRVVDHPSQLVDEPEREKEERTRFVREIKRKHVLQGAHKMRFLFISLSLQAVHQL